MILSFTSPLHNIIGDAIAVILAALVGILVLFTFAWPLFAFVRDLFGVAEPNDYEPVPFEQATGAPRDGGLYRREGEEWVRIGQDERREMLAAKKAEYRKANRDPEEWEYFAVETRPRHPGMVMEVLNDADGDFGPDDVEDEDEVEKPDDMLVGNFMK